MTMTVSDAIYLTVLSCLSVIDGSGGSVKYAVLLSYMGRLLLSCGLAEFHQVPSVLHK